jgi:hypothetical protein
MRQRKMLIAGLILLLITGCSAAPAKTAVNTTPIPRTLSTAVPITILTIVPSLSILVTLTPPVPTPVPSELAPGVDDGLISASASGDGATLILTGMLSRETFLLYSADVVGSRLAGRSSDPDQFRAILLGPDGQELETIAMWSPLDQFQWDVNNEHETRYTFTSREVDILVPISSDVETVILSWPEAPEIARIEVGDIIHKFCDQFPQNPACRP